MQAKETYFDKQQIKANLDRMVEEGIITGYRAADPSSDPLKLDLYVIPALSAKSINLTFNTSK